MSSLPQLRFLLRLTCVTAFFVTALLPVYVPQRAQGGATTDYELVSDQFLLVEEGFVMKTASISQQGHRLAYSTGISHEVGESESVTSIADLYNIAVETILWANDMEQGDVIHPGDTLLILPVDGIVHTVKRGQNLHKIAALYEVSLERIMSQNQLSSDRLYAGQELIIPGGSPILGSSLVADGGSTDVPARPGVTPERPRPTPAPEAAPPPSYGIFQKPCECVYTQYYHASHYAVDISGKGGSPIFAAEDGIVIRADYGWNGGYGNVIEIDHGNGLVTLYAHNRKLHVHEGNAVRRGDVIASMGNTGRVYGRTGIHLHFEVILNGIKKNPLLYLQ